MKNDLRLPRSLDLIFDALGDKATRRILESILASRRITHRSLLERVGFKNEERKKATRLLAMAGLVEKMYSKGSVVYEATPFAYGLFSCLLSMLSSA